MEEKQRKELIKKIIEEQDIVALYTYDGFNKSLGIMQEYSNGILYSELKKFILQNSEMLKKFTTKNLYTLLASTYDESEKQIINEQIAERLEKEDFFCEDIDSEVFLHPIHTYDSYGKIDKDVRNKINIELEKQLKELGKDQITLRFTYGKDESPKDVFVTYLQNALSELDGIKVEMVATTKQDRIYNKQKNGDFDLSVTRWGPDYGDPTTYLTLALTDNNNNYGHWSNAEYDSIMGKVNSETDANARWQLMIDAEKILCEDLGYIPVFEKGTATLQNTKVKNLGIKPVGVPYTFEYVSK